MKFIDFFDNNHIICKYEEPKNGLNDFHLTGYYYLGLILRAYYKYGIIVFPYYDIKHFNKAFEYYTNTTEHTFKNIKSVLLTLSIVNKKELIKYFKKNPTEILPLIILSYNIYPLYPLIFIYDIFNVVCLLFDNKPEDRIMYHLYRNITGFNLHIKLLNKILKFVDLNAILTKYFNPKNNIPPLYVLFDKLIEKVVK